MGMPRVLVIDDEEIIRISCVKCLKPEGYEVDVAGNGVDGLKLFEERDYAVILTDLKMPDVDGMEVLARARAIRPAAKVIMITGYSTVEYAVKAIKMGAFNYIEKPFTPDGLLTAVHDALHAVQEGH